MRRDDKDKPSWQEPIELSEEKEESLKKKIVRLFHKYATMWEGKLGRIEVT